MKVFPRNSAFDRFVKERYKQDADVYCAICGDGIYPDESVAWDDHNQICHAECVEEEEYEG